MGITVELQNVRNGPKLDIGMEILIIEDVTGDKILLLSPLHENTNDKVIVLEWIVETQPMVFYQNPVLSNKKKKVKKEMVFQFSLF